MNQKFTIPAKMNTIFLALMAVGAILFAIGALTGMGNASRIWTAVLYNSFFFLGISLIGLFFVAIHEIGFGGWMISMKRIGEAMSTYIPIGGIIVLIAVIFGSHDIYHWTHKELYDVTSDKYDALIAGKKAFLNMPFFTARSIIYVLLWSLIAFWFRRNSLNQDKNFNIAGYKKSKVISAIFLVVFAVTSSTAAWDWLMSIDPHWYSTLYGWYVFASIFVSGLCVIALITITLKSYGYLEMVNDEHLHDLGKMIFGFSVFWAYLWFSQFMLIWYANISEETLYYNDRFNGGYKAIFLLVFIVNFIFPFLTLITRGAKRTFGWMSVACVVLIIGHWLDFYVLTMPGALKYTGGVEASGMSIFIELALATFFVGLFGFVTYRSLSKAPLLQTNHPFVQESIYHHT